MAVIVTREEMVRSWSSNMLNIPIVSNEARLPLVGANIPKSIGCLKGISEDILSQIIIEVMEGKVEKPKDLLPILLKQIAGCICRVNGLADEAQVGTFLDCFGPIFNMWMKVCQDKFYRFCSRSLIWSVSICARLKLLVQFLLDDRRRASRASAEVDVCVLLDRPAQDTVNCASYKLGGRGLL